MAAPGPPSAGGKGYQVRLYNQIHGLASSHSITLITFGEQEAVDEDTVAACRRVIAIPRSPTRAVSGALLHARGFPLSVGLYKDRRMAAAVRSETAKGDHDLVHLQLVRMAPYSEEVKRAPIVLDLLDAAELNMHERARAAAPGVRQMLQVEATRLGAYERKAIATADMSLVISRRDLTYLGDPPSARVLPNGVEPLRANERPAEREAGVVILTGTMSYFPNVDAATWFVHEILPSVLQGSPQAAFRIVGREPTTKVRRLGSVPRVAVTGAVPSVASELGRAAVSVCPTRFGSGMQTKILEAMAVGTPVVATSMAIAGLPEDLHAFIRCADTPADFAQEVVDILNDPGPGMRRAADGLLAIRSHHTWKHSVAVLEDLYEEAVNAARSGERRR